MNTRILLLFQIAVILFALCAYADPSSQSASTSKKHHDKEKTKQLIDAGIKKLNTILSEKKLDSCQKCVSSLEYGHKIAKEASAGVVTEIMRKFCKQHAGSKHARKNCDYKFGLSTVNGSAYGDDITNVLTLIDPKSLDSQYICYHFLNGACPLPKTPEFDLSSWWPVKPKDAKQPDPSGKTFNVVHVSDFHVDLDYEVGSEANCSQSMCCNDWKYHKASPNTVQLPAQAYGSYQCDAPESLLQSSLSSISDIHKHKNFEFAIFTGDMVDHDDIEYLSMENAIATEKLVYSSMKKHLDMPIYVTLGNHDTYPYAQIAQNKSGFVNRFSWNTDLAYDMWRDNDWFSEKEAAQIKDHYAGFAVTTKRGLRVISLNANFWFLENYYNYWGIESDPDPSGLFRFLSDELLECEKKGQRAWVMAHVPMGSDVINALPPATQVFNQIVERFSPHVIAGVFFGHTHRDEFVVQYANNATEKTEENALSVAFLDESVTPYKFFNPGWRYYEVDEETFQVVNIHHYYSKLNDTFTSEPSVNDTNTVDLVWQYSYSSRDAYDPEGKWPKEAPLNATFWHGVAQKLLTDDKYRQIYMNFAYRMSPYVPDCNDGACIQHLYCYVTSYSVPQVIECMKENPIKMFSYGTVISSAIIIGALVGVAYYLKKRRDNKNGPLSSLGGISMGSSGYQAVSTQ